MGKHTPTPKRYISIAPNLRRMALDYRLMGTRWSDKADICNEGANACVEADAMREALGKIEGWLVCAAIATDQDMAQSFGEMLETTQAALALSSKGEA